MTYVHINSNHVLNIYDKGYNYLKITRLLSLSIPEYTYYAAL